MGNQGTDESELTGYTISLLDENGEILTEKEALSLGISRKKQPPLAGIKETQCLGLMRDELLFHDLYLHKR